MNPGRKPAKNNRLHVAFLQRENEVAGAHHPGDIHRQDSVFLSTSGHYYIDGIAVSTSDTEETLLYRDAYEWTDTYY